MAHFCKSLGFFYFYLLDYITRRTLILENQKKKNYKSQKMRTGCDNNHFKMFKMN